jgi:hypothetical protein
VGAVAVVYILKQFRRRYIYPWLKTLYRPLLPYKRATFAGIRVSYKGYLDGGGRGFGQDFIPLLHHYGLPKQERVFEWCAGPGFIGFSMLGHGLCSSLCLADINPEAVQACQRTVSENTLSDRVSVYCSDNLLNIPSTERWDRVVSNPPHFIDEYIGTLRAHDPDCAFTGNFCELSDLFLSQAASSFCRKIMPVRLWTPSGR